MPHSAFNDTPSGDNREISLALPVTPIDLASHLGIEHFQLIKDLMNEEGVWCNIHTPLSDRSALARIGRKYGTTLIFEN